MKVDEPQGYYRILASNNFWRMTFDAQLDYETQAHARLCRALCRHAPRLGVSLRAEALEPDGWLGELQQARQLIVSLIPHADTFSLVDDNAWWPGDIAGRHRVPFLEREGQYWGEACDDAQGIEELEQMRRSGARFLVFASPSFWWLDYYADYEHYLRTHFRCALQNEILMASDLR
ncbi:MAG: hypothetical protein LC737_11725 [Chloroflexi bacterium]|nr:hypothetical protein [Chloroflexota bacterium]